MSKWDDPLKNGKTPRSIVVQRSASNTDKEIAAYLSKMGFKATALSVRSVRVRSNVVKLQENNQKRDVHNVKGDVWDISLNRTPINSQDELIKEYKIDTRIWEVTEFNISRYEVMHGSQAIGSSSDWQRDDDDWTVVPLNSIRAKLKKRQGMEDAINDLEAIKESYSKYAPRPSVIKRPKKPTGNMLEISLTDIHLGKMSWKGQTGREDYDVSIGKQIVEDAVANLISRVEPYKFDEVVFVIGNDLTNTDNAYGTTYAGTPVESDPRYHRTVRMARELMADAVEKLRTIAPVRVVVVPGNHDKMTAWHIGESLWCYFRKYKDVTVENDPVSRKYVRWGNCLLMFTHGDKGKRLDYPSVMSNERPEDWGQTLYREVHTGDKHHTRVEEKFGVNVRILPSLTGVDAWHADNMFVGAQRRAEAFVWNKEVGLLGTAIYTYQEK